MLVVWVVVGFRRKLRRRRRIRARLKGVGLGAVSVFRRRSECGW